jgi:hypothetical protein
MKSKEIEKVKLEELEMHKIKQAKITLEHNIKSADA